MAAMVTEPERAVIEKAPAASAEPEPRYWSAAQIEASRRNGAKGNGPERIKFDAVRWKRLKTEGIKDVHVARALGMSLRTLRRRVAEHWDPFEN